MQSSTSSLLIISYRRITKKIILLELPVENSLGERKGKKIEMSHAQRAIDKWLIHISTKSLLFFWDLLGIKHIF